MKYANLSSFDEIAKVEPNKIQGILENWIMDLSTKGIKGSTIRVKLAPVELFLDMNRITYFKRILHKMIPRDDGILGGSEPFTTEEIRRMLESTKKLRTKAFVHFLASTGIRPGAIIDPILRRKHIAEMPDGCLAVKVYDNSKEGYWAFLTPEARHALYHYFDSRKLNGEVLTDESPIFANERAHKKNDHFGYNSFKVITTNLLKSAGITRIKSGGRYNKAGNYGFRKRFNTILKINNDVNSNITEKLMAHTNGLDGRYLTPTRDECFNEFKKAISQLTINAEERLRLENQILEKENEELESRVAEVVKLREGLKTEKERMDDAVKVIEYLTRKFDETSSKLPTKKIDLGRMGDDRDFK